MASSLVAAIAIASSASDEPPIVPKTRGFISSPAWAPDDRIAWSETASPPGDGQRIWIAAPDGSGAHPVSKPLAVGVAPGLETLGWLPDGRLVFTLSVAVYTARPQHRPSLVEPNAADFSADADGRVLATAYCGYSPHDCAAAVRIHNLRTGAVHAVAGGRVRDELPAVSPNGRFVVFVRTRCTEPRCDSGSIGELPGLWISSTRAGARPRRLAALGRCAAWSPDGTQVAYVAVPRPTNFVPLALRVLDVRTGRTRTLVADAPTQCPVWSPTGRWIAYANELNGQNQPPHGLVLVDAKTGRTQRMFDSVTVDGLAWAPDASRLVVLAGPTLARSCPSLWIYDMRDGSDRKIRQCAR